MKQQNDVLTSRKWQQKKKKLQLHEGNEQAEYCVYGKCVIGL